MRLSALPLLGRGRSRRTVRGRKREGTRPKPGSELPGEEGLPGGRRRAEHFPRPIDVKTHSSATASFLTGAAVGFGSLAAAGASLGGIVLLPAVAVAAILLVLRTRARSVFLVGAGLGLAVPWGRHVTSGDTPDNQLWPIFLGLSLVAGGVVLLLRAKPATDVS